MTDTSSRLTDGQKATLLVECIAVLVFCVVLADGSFVRFFKVAAFIFGGMLTLGIGLLLMQRVWHGLSRDGLTPCGLIWAALLALFLGGLGDDDDG